jgi:hypothetical protein
MPGYLFVYLQWIGFDAPKRHIRWRLFMVHLSEVMHRSGAAMNFVVRVYLKYYKGIPGLDAPTASRLKIPLGMGAPHTGLR